MGRPKLPKDILPPQEPVTIKLIPKQMEAYKVLTDMGNGVNELLYGGGSRGGKTVLGCLWQILNRFKYPGSAGMIGRCDFTSMQKTTMVTFNEVLKMLPEYYRNQMHWVGGTVNAWKFDNGSVIWFCYFKEKPTDPNFDRFGSYNLTDLFIDESQEVSEKCVSVLRGRMSLLKGEYPDGSTWEVSPKSLYCCNPSRGWIYSLFYKPHKEGTLISYRRFIQSLPADNPHVPQSYIDQLMHSDKVTVQRLVYGNFEYDDDPSALIDYDAIENLFVNIPRHPTGVKTGSADIAGKGHDRFIGGDWTGNVVRIAIDESYSPGKKVEEDIRAMMKEGKIPPYMMIVDADGVGNFLGSYIPGIKEFHGGGRPGDRRYANLRSECYFKLVDYINKGLLKIICTPEQREKIKEELAVIRQMYIDDDTKKKTIISKDEMKKLLGRSPDYADMLMMGMWFRRVLMTQGAKVKVHRTR